MPAKIVVKSGAAASTEVVIQEDVLRIGSDPSCEVVLPDAGLAPHAATLEFRDGAYVIHNRSDAPIRLNNVVLERRTFKKWNAGQDLALTDHLVLRLEVDGSPAPVRAAQAARRTVEVAGSNEANESRPAPTSAATARKKQLQMVIILLLVAVVVGLLFIDTSGPAPTTAPAPRDEFAALVKELQQHGKRDEGLLFLLQDARMAQVRGDARRARDLYGQIVDYLLPRRAKDGKFSNKLDQRLWDFVTANLVPPE
ncbi:MAG: FHA domain-containing protein [Gemmataceae bacterium]|nr:FHA domain-containing protein [Gemmataceae bacterium]